MKYVEIIKTQKATVYEIIKVRVPVRDGKTQEELRHQIESEGVAEDLCEEAEHGAYFQCKHGNVFVGSDEVERIFYWEDDAEIKIQDPKEEMV